MMIATNSCKSDTVFTEITVEPANVTASAEVSTDAGCAPLTVDFTNFSTPGAIIDWNFGDGNTLSQQGMDCPLTDLVFYDYETCGNYNLCVEIIYKCPEICTINMCKIVDVVCEEPPICETEAPLFLECSDFNGINLFWEPVASAIRYEVVISLNNPNCCGKGDRAEGILETGTNSLALIGNPSCFSWRVRAICDEEGSVSPWSDEECYRPGICTLFPGAESRGNGLVSNPSIYPNPSSGKFTLQMDAPEDLILSVNIFSPDGKLVQSLTEREYADGLFKETIDLDESLQDGIYFIFFKTNYGDFQEKLIISKNNQIKN